MNQILLGHRLGALSSPVLQRFQNETLLSSLEHDEQIRFAASRSIAQNLDQSTHAYAHQAGCTTLSTSGCGQFLASGGTDASVRLWSFHGPKINGCSIPLASVTRGDPQAQKNSISSLSIYPFDPQPSSLFTTSHDKTFLLTQITPTALTPLHSFGLDFAPYCHAISPIPSPQPLVAVGTAHPAIRLLDLRSGHSTHSLPGHNGSVYSIAWSPRVEHVLVSGATDGRVLFFDIRRANAAFGSLDLDDAVGSVLASQRGPSQLLNFGSVAHNGPVTSVQFTPYPDCTRLVTTGHDQRIRVWDVSTARNELVHFGPRIRNDRQGQLAPLISPPGYASRSSREMLFWPNDDAKGDVYQHSIREGELVRVLKLAGMRRNEELKGSARLLGKGRTNQIVWRAGAGGHGLEMLSAHGDGSIGLWRSMSEEEDEDLNELGEEDTGPKPQPATLANDSQNVDYATNKKKRKREMLEGLVEGLTRMPAN